MVETQAQISVHFFSKENEPNLEALASAHGASSVCVCVRVRVHACARARARARVRVPASLCPHHHAVEEL